MRFDVLTIGLAWLILICPMAQAIEQKDLSASGADRIFSVTSGRLEADDANRTMTFLGDVVGRQDDLVIYAERLTVFFEPERMVVEKIVASGDVRIVHEDRVATAGKAVFFRREGKVVLSDSPKVHQGENFIEGEEITLFLDERRSVVSGGQSRVNAVFHSEEKKP